LIKSNQEQVPTIEIESRSGQANNNTTTMEAEWGKISWLKMYPTGESPTAVFESPEVTRKQLLSVLVSLVTF